MKETFNYIGFVSEIKEKRFDIQKQLGKNFGVRYLAKDCDISFPTMHRALKGNTIELQTAISICSWLDKPVTDFVI